MLDRLLPIEVFRGHWKSLSDYRDDPPRPDWVTRAVLVLGSLAVATFLLLSEGAKIGSPDALLAGLALFAGGLLAAFGEISSMRTKLTEASDDESMIFESYDRVPSGKNRMYRKYLDETAAHMLVASYLSALSAGVLVFAMVILGQDTAVTGMPAAIAGGAGTYVVITFLIALPRVYVAYVQMHKVSRQLSGTHRGR